MSRRKLFVALALALVLLVPGTPAPTRAGTFEFVIEGPLFVLIEADAALENIFAVACTGAGGASVPWIAVTAVDNQVDEGYVGTAATLKDKPDKLKAKYSDKAKNAASEEIQHVDVDASTDPDTGTAEGVKATMKGNAKPYVVDPEEIVDAAGVTAGKLKVNDKTNKQKLTIDANIAIKVTDTEITCTLEFDDTGKAAGLRVSGAELDGLNLRIGR